MPHAEQQSVVKESGKEGKTMQICASAKLGGIRDDVIARMRDKHSVAMSCSTSACCSTRSISEHRQLSCFLQSLIFICLVFLSSFDMMASPSTSKRVTETRNNSLTMELRTDGAQESSVIVYNQDR